MLQIVQLKSKAKSRNHTYDSIDFCESFSLNLDPYSLFAYLLKDLVTMQLRLTKENSHLIADCIKFCVEKDAAKENIENLFKKEKIRRSKLFKGVPLISVEEKISCEVWLIIETSIKRNNIPNSEK